jgi:hypothetical protein
VSALVIPPPVVSVSIIVVVAVSIIVRATAVICSFIVRVSALAYLIHLDEIAIVVDVDVVADASLAGVEAVRQARPFNADVVIAAPMERIFSLVQRVHSLDHCTLVAWELGHPYTGLSEVLCMRLP